MASRRRLKERFAIASHAVGHHRPRRRPVLEVLEDRVVLATEKGDGSLFGERLPSPYPRRIVRMVSPR